MSIAFQRLQNPHRRREYSTIWVDVLSRNVLALCSIDIQYLTHTTLVSYKLQMTGASISRTHNSDRKFCVLVLQSSYSIIKAVISKWIDSLASGINSGIHSKPKCKWKNFNSHKKNYRSRQFLTLHACNAFHSCLIYMVAKIKCFVNFRSRIFYEKHEFCILIAICSKLLIDYVYDIFIASLYVQFEVTSRKFSQRHSPQFTQK